MDICEIATVKQIPGVFYIDILKVNEAVLTQGAFTDWLFVAGACGSGKKSKEVDVGDRCMFFYRQQEKTIP